jgi:hypothetical protein
MSADTVRIESLHLRVPGMSRKEAAGFGEDVAREMQHRLGTTRPFQRIGAMNLQVVIPAETPRDGLAAMVAERILLGLRR